MKGDEIIKKFDEHKNIPTKQPKAKKNEFGYVEDVINPRCGFCNMYLIGGKCVLVKGAIDPMNGSCNFWSYRRSKPPSNSDAPFMSATEAGYLTNPNGPKCGSCRYFVDPNKCKKVEGNIDADTGCCNRWEKK